ncbi:MAG: 5-formyltetrahydrofolate cyclo-ligase [Steroidobacteraceae bacterium]
MRRELRQRRRALSPSQRQLAARQLAIQFDQWHLLKPDLRIAVYLAMLGELDLTEFIKRARARHCQLYVPHIINAARHQMSFIPLPVEARLKRHRWGMAQLHSAPRQRINIRQLDMVLVPTVAFDAYGNRLGMGAGFYDRHLACVHRNHWQRPRLIGVAYAMQQVERIPTLAHDVPLSAVMTERGLHRSVQTKT